VLICDVWGSDEEGTISGDLLLAGQEVKVVSLLVSICHDAFCDAAVKVYVTLFLCKAAVLLVYWSRGEAVGRQL